MCLCTYFHFPAERSYDYPLQAREMALPLISLFHIFSNNVPIQYESLKRIFVTILVCGNANFEQESEEENSEEKNGEK